MPPTFDLTFFTIGFCLIVLSGFFIAYLYGHAVKRFRWSEYAAIAVWPIIVNLLAAYWIDVRFLYLFLLSAVIGMTAEYLLGLAWHKTLNRRFWTYSRLSINGYTSFLTIPFWGNAGIIFMLLLRSLGL